MDIQGGSLLDDIAGSSLDETVAELVATPGIRIERIVSTGQVSPPGFWYDQSWSEWVLVISGSAGLLFEDEDSPRALNAGDYILIPAHCRHRVAWTVPGIPTIWLAVHFDSAGIP